jgi:coproporphyrinogen III oxidase-like Fe-S oxidoreductase
MKKPNKRPKKLISDRTKKFKKETKACHHNRVGYPALQKLALGMFARSKQDADNIKNLSEILHSQKLTIDENKKGISILVDKYEDRIDELEKQIEELTKQRNESTRAYNGLAQMGKFAEDMDIDLQSAKDDLPETEKNKYDFKQTDTVMESGKVKHEMFLKPKQRPEGHFRFGKFIPRKKPNGENK